ncbi:hypothetical protein N9L47_11285 [Rhodobacteraceae bacterium]|nr:hypothetical protein [Paracoccaceae bacterium]
MVGLGAWLFVLTIITFVLEWRSFQASEIDRQREREAQNLSRMSQAWDTLLRPVGGNTGKGNALNLLVSQDAGLSSLDLSCEAIGDFRDGVCLNPHILEGVDLTMIGIDRDPFIGFGSALMDVDFSGATIIDLSVASLAITAAFKDVNGAGWDVENLSGQLIFDQSVSESLGEFRCFGCRVNGGEIPWWLFDAFQSSVITNALILLHPRDSLRDQFGLENRFVRRPNRTTLDEPVRILRTIEGEITGNYIDPKFQDESAATDALVWDVYRDLKYCANSEDMKRLQLTEKTVKRLRLSDTARVPLFQTKLVTTAFPEGEIYQCDLDFEDVQPLLRQRLSVWSHVKSDGMFRIGPTR